MKKVIFSFLCVCIVFTAGSQNTTPMQNPNPILGITPIDFMWPVLDPFIFCAHHKDHYPNGNEFMGPDASLIGRDIGQDFTMKDGWRMYHGDTVPGFPSHPHRGFETVTIVKTGLVDHSDSHGQSGRYGNGDVQWMTAGSGLQHSEMFPLLNKDKENPAELFQVWLNLPKSHKLTDPFFKMLWSEDIPVIEKKDLTDKITRINLIAGTLFGTAAPAPAPDSWAANPENEVMILTIAMQAGAEFELPAATAGIYRALYFYEGSQISIQNDTVNVQNAIQLQSGVPVKIKNANTESLLVLLQGAPIGEPVVQYGPFVMNTEDEIRKAFSDYRETEFGGWPWPRYDMVHDRNLGRFAKYRNGTIEKP